MRILLLGGLIISQCIKIFWLGNNCSHMYRFSCSMITKLGDCFSKKVLGSDFLFNQGDVLPTEFA